MKKIMIEKDVLYDLYIIKNMNIKDISKQLNTSISTISKKINSYGIKKDKKIITSNFKKTMKERYGENCFSVSEQTIQKRKETCLRKYGVENPLQNEVIKNKQKSTCFKKYGCEYYLSSKQSQEKIKRTVLNKYGVENISQLNEIKQKKIKKSIEKYGVDNVFKSDIVKRKIKSTNIKKYGFSNPMKDYSIKSKLKNTVSERYGVPYYCMTENCRNASGVIISKINKEFSNLLSKHNIKNELEFNIENKSYDIHILNTNIVIELNPTYTHNSTNPCWFNNHSKEPLLKDYHYNKTLLANKNGYRCIHIWDWDDIEKIIKMLEIKEKIYAKSCKIYEVPEDICNKFLNENHLQGTCKNQDIRLGLYYKDKLVQVMTFGKPRYNKKYEYELLRLCSFNKYIIVGGTEKLFKYFLSKYNPSNIISYCDNSKFSGNIYNILGFELLDYGKPSKHWYNPKTKKHITDNLLRQRGYDQLFKTNYGKGESNEKLMKSNGFVEIYDSGQSLYSYRNF